MPAVYTVRATRAGTCIYTYLLQVINILIGLGLCWRCMHAYLYTYLLQVINILIGLGLPWTLTGAAGAAVHIPTHADLTFMGGFVAVCVGKCIYK